MHDHVMKYIFCKPELQVAYSVFKTLCACVFMNPWMLILVSSL
jgi:hypothetical protein